MEQISIDLAVAAPIITTLHELEHEAPPAELGFLRALASTILERSGVLHSAAPPRVVALTAACAGAAAALARDLSPSRVFVADTSAHRISAALRRATTQEAPRGRVLAVALQDSFAGLDRDGARQLLRELRKALIRGDALLIGTRAAADPRAEHSALDADTALTLCAAAGFRLLEQWIEHPEASALTLVHAD